MGPAWNRASSCCAAALGLLFAVMLLSPLHAEEEPVFDFETDAQGWYSTQMGSVLATTRDATAVKVGQGSLDWFYNPAFEAQLRRTEPNLKADGNTLEFWLRCSATASFQLNLSEQDGSSYRLIFRVPANAWRHYQIPLSDLTLGETTDENGQLDLNQVTFIQLMDSSRFSATPAELQARHLWLDGIRFSSPGGPLRRATRTVDGKQELPFDDFETDVLAWGGRVSVDLQTARVDGRGVLRCRYPQPTGGKAGVGITDHIDLRYAGMKALKVVARASQPVKLAAVLREFDGGPEGPNYRAFVEIPEGREWSTVVVPLSAFQLAPNSKKDANGKLDVGQVWLIHLGDYVQAPDPQNPKPVELEIDSIAAVLE